MSWVDTSPPRTLLFRTRFWPHARGAAGSYVILMAYVIIAAFPVLLIAMNSLKTRVAIFAQPYLPPLAGSFSLVGYQTMFERAHFGLYFANSAVVTGSAMVLILLLGAMAAFALAEYQFRGNTWLGLYLALGIMIPIRLGTVSILRLMVGLGLVNTLPALILVYTAQGLPLAVFVLQQFMRTVPRDLKDAARIDGMSEYRIFWLVLPLVRPAVATVAVFTMIPIWNDLWFPLILTSSDSTHTVTLGVQQFLGQYITDWNSVLAALSMAILPVVVIYVILSRQLIAGLTSGAVK